MDILRLDKLTPAQRENTLGRSQIAGAIVGTVGGVATLVEYALPSNGHSQSEISQYKSENSVIGEVEKTPSLSTTSAKAVVDGYLNSQVSQNNAAIHNLSSSVSQPALNGIEAGSVLLASPFAGALVGLLLARLGISTKRAISNKFNQANKSTSRQATA